MPENCGHMECVSTAECQFSPVRCSECLYPFMRRADGTVRTHGPINDRCPGSGKPPAVMHDPLGPDGWARALIEEAIKP